MNSVGSQDQNRHSGSKSEFVGVDVEQMIESSSCGQYYMALESCLVETDRNWRKCQNEVKALKNCNEVLKTSQGKTNS